MTKDNISTLVEKLVASTKAEEESSIEEQQQLNETMTSNLSAAQQGLKNIQGVEWMKNYFTDVVLGQSNSSGIWDLEANQWEHSNATQVFEQYKTMFTELSSK